MNPFVSTIHLYEHNAQQITTWHKKGLVSSEWAIREMRKLGLDCMLLFVESVKSGISMIGKNKFYPHGISEAVDIKDSPGSLLH